MTPHKGCYRVTSARGYREYWYNGVKIKEDHKGIDSVGVDTKQLRAIWDCIKAEVVMGYNSGRGNLARLYFSSILRVIYQHLASASITSKSTVRQGGVVAMEGATGKVTGSHLHIEPQVLVQGIWQPVRAALCSQFTEMPNAITPAGKYLIGNDNLDNAAGIEDPTPAPDTPTPADGKVYVPRISIARAGALELFTDPHVNAVIKGDGPGVLVGSTRRLDMGNFIGLEKVQLAGMPAAENAEGYKILYQGEKLYVATKLAFATVQQRSMEQIAKEINIERILA